MTSSLSYEYSRGAGKDRHALGSIECAIYASAEDYDDGAARLPIYQITQSHDAKSGVTTVSGFIESDLQYFEPQLAWEDMTSDGSSPKWPECSKEEGLCITIYCDGETKKPVVEYRKIQGASSWNLD